MDFSFQLAHGEADHVPVDAIRLAHVTGEQRLVAHRVHQARDALAVLMDAPERRSGEIRGALGAGHREPVLDIVADLKPVQRPQVIAHGDALTQLAQARVVEPRSQLGLAEQHDLQQLAIVGFQVRAAAPVPATRR